MKFTMSVKTDIGSEFDETYDFPVKTIKGATKYAQAMVDKFNEVEELRYKDRASCRILVSVDFAKEDDIGE